MVPRSTYTLLKYAQSRGRKHRSVMDCIDRCRLLGTVPTLMDTEPYHKVHPRARPFVPSRLCKVSMLNLASTTCFQVGRLQHLSSKTSPILSEEEVRTIEDLAHRILPRNIPTRPEEINEANMRRRMALSKSITLVESTSIRKRRMADMLLKKLRQQAASDGNNMPLFRLGIAGHPGS